MGSSSESDLKALIFCKMFEITTDLALKSPGNLFFVYHRSLDGTLVCDGRHSKIFCFPLSHSLLPVCLSIVVFLSQWASVVCLSCLPLLSVHVVCISPSAFCLFLSRQFLTFVCLYRPINL
jgi:hypothetical protein